MNIDMRLATVEWLVEWKAQRALRPHGSLYRNLPENLAIAQTRYIVEALEIYLDDRSRISDTNKVILVSSGTLNREDLATLTAAEFTLLNGEVARFAYLDTCEIWYPYEENPNQALELVFST